MESQGFGIILLVFLLVSGIVVSDVVAKPDTTSNGTINVDTYQLPALQFDDTQLKIIIDKELSPSPDAAASQKSRMAVASESPAAVKIPSGSIIHHSKDGVTTVFDSTGQQLFAADDAQAKLVPTPRGQLPATCVHEVPSGSVIYKRDNITYVISNNNLILVEIKEKSGENDNIPDKTTPGKSAGYTTLGASTAGADNPLAYWIERVTFDTPYDTSSEYLKNYSAQWKVPSPPRTTTPNQVQYLAIEEEAFEVNNNGTVAFASVLEWNYYPNTWDITTWMHDYNVRIMGYFSQREVVNTGDIISGDISSSNLYGYPPPYPIRVAWSVRSSDQSGHSSELSLNSNSLIESRGGADTLLMLSGDTTLPSEDYLVGDTIFWSYIFTDNNDNPLNPPIRWTYINYALAGNPAFPNLRIKTDNWPEKIVLGTQPDASVIEKTYSITSVYYNPFSEPDSRFQQDTECQIVIDELKSAGWGEPVFYHKNLNVTSVDLGFNGGGLAENTFHWHTGHGWYNPSDPDPSSSGITLLRRDGTTFQLTPVDVAGRWNTKNKWVVFDVCLALGDPLWNKALGTTHGIFGFTTATSGNTNLPKQFFYYTKEEKYPLAQAWRNATIDTYYSIQAPDYIHDPKKYIPIQAAVRFDNEAQSKNDHLPGYGIIELDENPNDGLYFYNPWNCVKES